MPLIQPASVFDIRHSARNVGSSAGKVVAARSARISTRQRPATSMGGESIIACRRSKTLQDETEAPRIPRPSPQQCPRYAKRNDTIRTEKRGARKECVQTGSAAG